MKIKDLKQLWKTALAQIEIKIDAPAQFKTFFQETQIIKIEGSNVVIGVPNPYTSEWLKNKYEKMIKDTLTYIYGETLNPTFQVLQNSLFEGEEEIQTNQSVLEQNPLLAVENGSNGDVINSVRKAGLNLRYTISNYIVGNYNMLAHAASVAVINNPGQIYNPLFIHGKTGLGKTHLAQAIAREILEKNPNKKVIYTSSEGFMNDMVKGIKSGQNDKVRAKFRSLDLLIIDDMQLISKWVHTQEEFFNTFNELHIGGKQIILISDRSPDEIKNIEARLKSRMQGGMVVDIKPPDYEMRLAILQKKAEATGTNLKPQIIEFIARSITENVRELEGALQKVTLFNQMKPNGDLSLEEVSHMLGRDIASKREQIKVPRVLKEVAKTFSVSVKDLKGPRRTKELALARQVAMYILREEFGYKLEEVANFLNREDHTTVIHAIDKVKSKMVIQDGFSTLVSKTITNIQDSAIVMEDMD